MESKTKLTIAFVPMDSYGAVNACTGLGQTLLKRGHRVVFIVNQTWKMKLSSYGFDVEIYHDSNNETSDASQHWTEFMHEYGELSRMSSFDQLKHFLIPVCDMIINDTKNINDLVKEKLSRVKPHVIIGDVAMTMPAIMTEDLPWVNLISCQLLTHTFEIGVLPPGGSGYSAYGDKRNWKKYHNEFVECIGDRLREFSVWIQSKGVGPIKDHLRFIIESPFLNLYLYPDELDYDDIRPKPFKWHNIDCLIRDEHNNDDFVIPESLREKRGKLIYLSMGSIISADISLMKRLVSILSESPNRFVVSKGPAGDHYELPINMWGDCVVPQTKILPLVDMVITHGGNNTVTETLLFGKPMIVMPVFFDQNDNAQRIHEKELGIRLDPYHCEPMKLLNAIETLISDAKLKERLTNISERIKNSNSKIRAAELIEDLVKNQYFKHNDLLFS